MITSCSWCKWDNIHSMSENSHWMGRSVSDQGRPTQRSLSSWDHQMTEVTNVSSLSFLNFSFFRNWCCGVLFLPESMAHLFLRHTFIQIQAIRYCLVTIHGRRRMNYFMQDSLCLMEFLLLRLWWIWSSPTLLGFCAWNLNKQFTAVL